LRVADGHLALRLRNIWAALEKIGRKRSIDVGRLGRKCARGKMEIGSGLADQHGDSILKLFALLLQEDCLSLCGVEKSFLLSHVEARGNATIVARIYQVQTFLQCIDRARIQRKLRIDLPQRKIVRGKFRGQNQPHIFQVGGGSLEGSLRRFNRAPTLTEKVHLIANAEGQRVIVLRNRGP
jgi:hypothetical protein